MCVLSIKVPIRKKSGNLSYAPRTNENSNLDDLFKSASVKLVGREKISTHWPGESWHLPTMAVDSSWIRNHELENKTQMTCQLSAARDAQVSSVGQMDFKDFILLVA